jgi:hypothetical protein
MGSWLRAGDLSSGKAGPGMTGRIWPFALG